MTYYTALDISCHVLHLDWPKTLNSIHSKTEYCLNQRAQFATTYNLSS